PPHSAATPPPLPSSPTRRSSDLRPRVARLVRLPGQVHAPRHPTPLPRLVEADGHERDQEGEGGREARHPAGAQQGQAREGVNARSEEHTSELQSLTNIVCRLLLE